LKRVRDFLRSFLGIDEPIKVGFQLSHPAGKAPVRAYPTDAGFDISIPNSTWIDPGTRLKIYLGIQVEIPDGYEIQVRLRSSLAARGLCIPSGIGTIDAHYRGDVFLPVVNLSDEQIIIEQGERVCQFVVKRVPDVTFVGKFIDRNTDRGLKGCGSSGRF
jgi:dUTP pyrophosphatase